MAPQFLFHSIPLVKIQENANIRLGFKGLFFSCRLHFPLKNQEGYGISNCSAKVDSVSAAAAGLGTRLSGSAASAAVAAVVRCSENGRSSGSLKLRSSVMAAAAAAAAVLA